MLQIRKESHRSCLCRILIVGIATFTVLASPLHAQQTVTLAIAGPMVGSSFSVGAQYKAGVTAAIQNLPNGLLLKRKVMIKTYDDSCKSAIAEGVARELVQNPPAVVIGHSCSAATIAAAPIYAANRVLQITPASTNPQVTEMGIATLFRMIGRDDFQGVIAAKWMANGSSGKKIGIFHFPGNYSAGLTQTAIRELKKKGIEPLKVIQGVASAPSYVNDIKRFIAADIDLLYLVGGGLDSGVFMRQARLMGATFEVLGGDTLVSKVFVETAGIAGENVPFTFPPDAARLSSSAAAVSAIKAMGLEPAGYTLLAYAATQVWLEGVTRAGSFAADRVAGAIRSGPIETILGPVSFDQKGDIKTDYQPFSWCVWKNGQRVAIEAP